MSASFYSVLMKIIAFALAAVIAVGIVLELPLYVPIVAVMVALIIAGILRRRVREIMVDERDHRIQEKATAMTYRIYTIVAAALALVALMLRSSLPAWAGAAAETLAYSVCGLMLLHLACTSYYARKL